VKNFIKEVVMRIYLMRFLMFVVVHSLGVYYGFVDTSNQGVTNVSIFFVWFFAIALLIGVLNSNDERRAKIEARMKRKGLKPLNGITRYLVSIFFKVWFVVLPLTLIYTGHYVLGLIYAIVIFSFTHQGDKF